ncbi:MAG: SMP-30/gluconolactonase/LRE family protein [Polyangiaceae bacterium]|nr:SMP-30/gluconolactonase/LRE family protein [Polyangiaceae bacterium]
MRRLAFSVLCLALIACGSSGSGGDSPPPATVGPPVGTVEEVVDLPTASEGIAEGPGPDGAPAIYVAAGGSVFRVGADRTTTKLAELPGPLGVAVQKDGSLIVCGKLPGAAGKAPGGGALWKITPSGEASVFVGAGGYELPNMVAIAPDGRVAFTDSSAGKVYLTGVDGQAVTPLGDVSYANGLAFSPDGARLYVASYDTKKVYALDRAGDGFSAPAVFADGVEQVDGVSVTAAGALVLVRSSEITLLAPGSAPRPIVAASAIGGVPANGAFGFGAYGDGWLYLSNLLSRTIVRVYVGAPGLPLPVAP